MPTPNIIPHKINWVVVGIVVLLHGVIAYALLKQKPAAPTRLKELTAKIIFSSSTLANHLSKQLPTADALKNPTQPVAKQKAQPPKNHVNQHAKKTPLLVVKKKNSTPRAQKPQVQTTRQATQTPKIVSTKSLHEKTSFTTKSTTESQQINKLVTNNQEVKNEFKSNEEAKSPVEAQKPKHDSTKNNPQTPIAEKSSQKESAPASPPAQKAPPNTQNDTDSSKEKDNKTDQPQKSLGISKKAGCQTPRPAYPGLSRKEGEEGQVKIRMVVTASGQIRDATIAKSSGYNRLDQAALAAVPSWDCRAAMQDGEQQSSVVIVPVSFKIDD